MLIKGSTTINCKVEQFLLLLVRWHSHHGRNLLSISNKLRDIAHQGPQFTTNYLKYFKPKERDGKNINV